MKYSYSYYNEEDFDTYVKQFDNYSLLQSREWAAVKSPIWENKKVLFIGICYDFQIIEKVPAEEHDVVLDFVVSESRIF